VCLIDNNSNTSIIIYVTVKDTVLPFTIIIGIYVRLYIRRLRRESAILLTTKCEVCMAQRMVFLLGLIALGSVPGTIFQNMQIPPDYQMRIYYFSIYHYEYKLTQKMTVDSFKSEIKLVTVTGRSPAHHRSTLFIFLLL
jgi:hypothetical protein